MIFVTTGTYGFPELVEAVDKLYASGSIKDQVIAQISSSKKYTPQHIEYMISTPDILEYMEKADFVICHGGTGTIMELSMLKKKIIAVPNKNLSDNHQYLFLKRLSETNSLVFCPEPDPALLLKAIESIGSFSPTYRGFFSEKLINMLQQDLSGHK